MERQSNRFLLQGRCLRERDLIVNRGHSLSEKIGRTVAWSNMNAEQISQ